MSSAKEKKNTAAKHLRWREVHRPASVHYYCTSFCLAWLLPCALDLVVRSENCSRQRNNKTLVIAKRSGKW
jgi:hypothetical protein